MFAVLFVTAVRFLVLDYVRIMCADYARLFLFDYVRITCGIFVVCAKVLLRICPIRLSPSSAKPSPAQLMYLNVQWCTMIYHYMGFPFTMEFPLQWNSLYKGFPFMRDLPSWGILLDKGFPFIVDCPLQLISLQKGVYLMRDFSLVSPLFTPFSAST